ncbi:hypothetical protein Q9189_005865 [Teloschistes chrysophthalmus]
MQLVSKSSTKNLAAEEDETNFDPDTEFINSLSQLLNSLTLWCSNDGTGQNLSAEQRDREATLLSNNLKKLENGLDNVVASICKELAVEFGDNIFDRYDTAVDNAVAEANPTTQHWGLKVNRENRALGGLYWSSYKAVCKRDGVYTNAQGLHEWNSQLSAPMMKVLSPGWEKMFSRRTPAVMANFAKMASGLIKKFHQDIDSRARKIGLGLAGFYGLKQQLPVHENILKDVSREVGEFVNNSQKEINREFVPTIQEAMLEAYQQCAAEVGGGQFLRIKAIMTGHVDQNRHTMFRQSVDGVRQQLKKLTKDVEARMNDKTDEVFVAMQRDYRSVLGGGAPEGQLLPKSERMLRKELLHIVEGVETIFRKVAAGEKVEDDEDEDDEDSPRRGGTDLLLDQSDTQVKHEDDVSNQDIDTPNADGQPTRVIKPEAQEEQMMTKVPEAQGGPSNSDNGESSDSQATVSDDNGEVPETPNAQLIES